MASQQPTEAELTKAVQALRISLISYDPDSAEDAAVLASRIKDDHVAWKKGVDAQSVGAVLAKIIASEKPVYDMSKVATFEIDWASVRGMQDFQDGNAWFDQVYGVHHAQGGIGSKGCYILFSDHGVVCFHFFSPPLSYRAKLI